MMKLVMALSCALMLVGCGSSQTEHEKIVKELYSIIQKGEDRAAQKKFWEENVSRQFQDVCARRSETINSREFKNVFGTIAKSKDSPALNVIKTFKEGDLAASAIEAQCAGTVLYFLVGTETKDGPIQILGITSNKDTALQGGN